MSQGAAWWLGFSQIAMAVCMVSEALDVSEPVFYWMAGIVLLLGILAWVVPGQSARWVRVANAAALATVASLWTLTMAASLGTPGSVDEALVVLLFMVITAALSTWVVDARISGAERVELDMRHEELLAAIRESQAPVEVATSVVLGRVRVADFAVFAALILLMGWGRRKV